MDHIKNRPTSDVAPLNGGVIQAILPEPNMIEQVSPWRMNFKQIEPGVMETRVKVRSGGMLTLLEISMNRAVHQQGSAPPNTLTFGVSLSGGEFRWRGAEMQKESFLTFGTNDGFEGITDRAFHGLTYSVSIADLEALAVRIGLPVDDKHRSSGVFAPDQGPQSVQYLAKKALRYLQSDNQMAIDVNGEEEILTLFLNIAAHTSQHEDHSKSHVRARALRLALEFMEENAEHNVSISKVCETSGTSLRTLNRAFHEAFGIGPKAYYLRLRLGLLRRALLESAPTSLVSDSANSLGFWHMGQLAHDYRVNFGELPLETQMQPKLLSRY
nr:helix-turn-helix domain-containing protein [uncultured Shimia sp.]